MKRRMIRNFLLTMVSFVFAFALVGCTTFSGSSTGLKNKAKENSWSIRAKTITGESSRKVDFDEDDLTAFQIENTSKSGHVTLLLTQGDMEKSINITNQFNDIIDLSEFEPGEVKMDLEFDDVKNLDLTIEW